MPQIEIRPVISTDIVELIHLDHTCKTNYVWQMDRLLDDGQVQVKFREIRLPRSVQVPYPRLAESMADDWQLAPGLLTALHEGVPVGYVRLIENYEVQTAILRDIVVDHKIRRQGIATVMVMAAQNWAVQRGHRRITMEMPSKNFPGIKLALKLGYEFSGYNDSYYPNKDIALFFSRYLK